MRYSKKRLLKRQQERKIEADNQAHISLRNLTSYCCIILNLTGNELSDDGVNQVFGEFTRLGDSIKRGFVTNSHQIKLYGAWVDILLKKKILSIQEVYSIFFRWVSIPLIGVDK